MSKSLSVIPQDGASTAGDNRASVIQEQRKPMSVPGRLNGAAVTNAGDR